MDSYTKDEVVSDCDVPYIRQHKNKSRPLYGQALVAAMVYLTASCNGLSSGYSAILLPQLRLNSSGLQVDEDIESWIVSVYIGATSVGCLLSGVAMNLWGRKFTTQAGIASNSVGWLLIAFSKSHPIMLLGRALGGFGKGFTSPAITFHIEEMADPRLRGALSACILLTYSAGIMLMSMLGTNVSWEISASLGAAVSLLNLVGYFFPRESPVWYVRNNRIDQATDVFKWLWGSGREVEVNKVPFMSGFSLTHSFMFPSLPMLPILPAILPFTSSFKYSTKTTERRKRRHSDDVRVPVEMDLQELLQRIQDENREFKTETFNWKLYFKPHIIKPFFVVHIFNILQIVCGTNIFIFYAIDIISGMKTDGTLDVNLTNILTSTTRVIFMAISCLILVWVGRRTMSISSGVGSGLAAMTLGTLIYFQAAQAWLMTTLIILYVAFNTYGFFVLAPIMIGEILPSKIRCIAGAYIFTLNDIGMFGATKAFPTVAAAVGTHGLFWIFGGCSLTCVLFLYLLLPETKGRSLVEIEKYFLRPNILWITRKRNKRERNVAI